MAKIDNLFHLLHANHGSDLHLSAGNPPLLRIYGDLARVDAPVVTTEELLAVLREMVPMERVQAFEQTGDLDFAYEIPGLARYRANFFRQNRGISAVFREIPQQISTVEELGLPIMLRELALLPKGLVLVTGPTGSGKSTSLYSILQLLNKPDVNAITLEDPVEYNIHGINQVQINEKTGMTFAGGLRSILRQDPDIIAVGEIRDGETAQIAMRAAITGHLVLSTIHTNNAIATIERLLDIGVEPYLISSALNGVISQRLVRKICPECREEYTPTEEELKSVGFTKETAAGHKFYHGKGCSACYGTGYRGRIGVFEILLLDGKLRTAISKNKQRDEITAIANESGHFTTLAEGCRKLILDGTTTISEARRITNTGDYDYED